MAERIAKNLHRRFINGLFGRRQGEKLPRWSRKRAAGGECFWAGGDARTENEGRVLLATLTNHAPLEVCVFNIRRHVIFRIVDRPTVFPQVWEIGLRFGFLPSRGGCPF